MTESALHHELDRLRAEVADQRARLAALEVGPESQTTDDPAVSRRRLLGLAGAGLVGAGIIGGAAPAHALDGDTLTVGGTHSGTNQTSLSNSGANSLALYVVNTDNANVQPALGVDTGDGFAISTSNNSDARATIVSTNLASNGTALDARADDATGVGLYGRGNVGVYGGNLDDLASTTSSIGVNGSNWNGRGVLADSVHGIGLDAVSTNGLGARVASTNGVPLHIVAGSDSGAPDSGTHSAGQLYVDSAGDLYYCTGAGSPGTWAKLNDQTQDVVQGPSFLPTSQRAYDSRTSKGGPGAFSTGETRTIDLTTSTDFPAGAAAVILNLTLVGTTGANGFVSVYSGDQNLSGKPAFSNINWFGPDQILANTTTSATGTAGTVKIYASGVTDVLIDVVGSYAA